VDKTAPKRLLCFVSWVALGMAILLLAWLARQLLFTRYLIPSGDFIEYWSAGRLLLAGDNPYDPTRLLAVQQAAGRVSTRPLLMYNPPWIFPLIIPFALLPYSISRLVWLGFQVAVLFFCASSLWRLYSGQQQRVWISWIILFTFLPTLTALLLGQLGPFVLLGVVLFLNFEHQRNWIAAGLAILLIALKPQLCFLFWWAFLLWCFRYKKWTLLMAVSLSFLAALALPLSFNSKVIAQYLDAVVHFPPVEWVTPTLGAALRLWLGAEKFWLQFIPATGGVIWLLLHWHKCHANWDWKREMGKVVLISFLTSPYAWLHDHVVLMLTVMPVLVIALSSHGRLLWYAIAGYLLINGLAWALYVLYLPGESWFIWLSPALGFLYGGVFRFHGELALSTPEN